MYFEGTITSLDWDGMTSYYFKMDAWVKVSIPQSHVMMLSVLHIDISREFHSCNKSYVATYTDPSFSQPQTMYCGKTLPGPTLFDPHSRAVFVRFYSNAQRAQRGFKLQFSFHPESARPQQLPNGRWNCSLPHWPHIQQHFPCNLQADCEEMEDEEACPYTTADCGRGKVSVGHSCYIYHVHRRAKTAAEYVRDVFDKEGKTSWGFADLQCRRRGAYLASLGSYRELQDVREMLYSVDDAAYTWIGIIPVEVSMPYL